MNESEEHPEVEFRFRDFLFPQRLLARTRADDNPLIIHSERRAQRWHRRALRHALEGVLLALGVAVLAEGGSDIGRLMPPSLWSLPYLIDAGLPWTLAVAGLLLLRYHLLVNDHSHHIKLLSPDQMLQLRQTRLGREEYFLHHFLMFCLRYRVLVAFAILAGLRVLYSVLTDDLRWITSEYYLRIGLGLSLILLTWVAGAWQCVLQSRMLAGRRWRAVKALVSWIVSLVLSLAVSAFCFRVYCSCLGASPYRWAVGPRERFSHYDSTGAEQMPWLVALIVVAAVFLIACALVFRYGKQTNLMAMDILRWRFFDRDPDAAPYVASFAHSGRLGASAFLLPWQWFIPGASRDAWNLERCFLAVLACEAWWALTEAGYWFWAPVSEGKPRVLIVGGYLVGHQLPVWLFRGAVAACAMYAAWPCVGAVAGSSSNPGGWLRSSALRAAGTISLACAVPAAVCSFWLKSSTVFGAIQSYEFSSLRLAVATLALTYTTVLLQFTVMMACILWAALPRSRPRWLSLAVSLAIVAAVASVWETARLTVSARLEQPREWAFNVLWQGRIVDEEKTALYVGDLTIWLLATLIALSIAAFILDAAIRRIERRAAP